jgi:membrane protein DedA with SNARE-associated domain/membrane-associated phospholipid phosphatase
MFLRESRAQVWTSNGSGVSRQKIKKTTLSLRRAITLTELTQGALDYIGSNPTLGVAAAFLIAMGEALLIIGLFVPSTATLIAIGGLVGLGKLPFWPVFIATFLGAVAGDAISFWVGYIYRDRLKEIWPFSRYRGLFEAGQAYFAKHGGKSVVIGRFIPGVKAVVPGIAGMMDMGVVRFQILNVLSAIVWAAAHILPGISAGLALQWLGSISRRLAIVLLILILVMVAVVWLARAALRIGLAYLPDGFALALHQTGLRQTRVGVFLQRLISPGEEDFRLFVVLNVVLASATAGCAWLVQNVATRDSIAAFDRNISQFLQSIRTSWTDVLMVAVTLMSGWPVTIAITIAGAAVLVLAQRRRIALGLIAAMAATLAFVMILTLIVPWSPPAASRALIEGGLSRSHAALSAALLGVIGFIILRGVGPVAGRVVVAICGCLIALVALSRMYLAAEWPSDVGAGLLFGAALTAIFALAFHDEEVSFSTAMALAAAATVSGLLVGSWQLSRNFADDPFFANQYVARTIIMSTSWRDGGWSALSRRRVDLAGEAEEPMLLQWRGGLQSLQQALEARGWKAAPAWSIDALNGFAFPDTPATALPAAPKFHDGRREVFTALRPLDDGQSRLVLRVWPENVRDPAGRSENFYVGAVVREGVEHPFKQLSIPLRAGSRHCDAVPLLANLPQSSVVGDVQLGSAGACGGQTVLAGEGTP